MPELAPFREARRFAITLALAGLGVLPAQAAKNSAPAQVMMVATMPATFSLQAAPATLTGATGSLRVEGPGHGTLMIRGQLRGHGRSAVVRIPLSLAANTRSFVVQAQLQGGNRRGSVYLGAPGLVARRIPMRGQPSLALAAARNYGREFFSLNQPLRTTLEIVFNDLPAGQASDFTVSLTLRDLGY
ncbi:MAG: hypothetical protein ACM3PW_05035 [Chlamydiota bacterium]